MGVRGRSWGLANDGVEMREGRVDAAEGPVSGVECNGVSRDIQAGVESLKGLFEVPQNGVHCPLSPENCDAVSSSPWDCDTSRDCDISCDISRDWDISPDSENGVDVEDICDIGDVVDIGRR